MTEVVAAQSGVAEGLGLTSWDPGQTLDEDAVYYWTARARTAGEAPEDFSPWSEPASFRVDAVNEPPTAPRPLRPIGGAGGGHALPVARGRERHRPGGRSARLPFRDRHAGLPSTRPARQASPELPAGAGETSWTPSVRARREHALLLARARERRQQPDAVRPRQPSSSTRSTRRRALPWRSIPWTAGRWARPRPPCACATRPTPTGDTLTYEIEVRDAGGAVVAGAPDIPEGPEETTWTVTDRPRREPGLHVVGPRQRRRARPGRGARPPTSGSTRSIEPPTAPVPLLPADGAVVERAASRPRGRERHEPGRARPHLHVRARGGRRRRIHDPRRAGRGRWPRRRTTTAWTPSIDLADGSYQWRARASDSRRERALVGHLALRRPRRPAARRPHRPARRGRGRARAPRLEREPRARRRRATACTVRRPGAVPTTSSRPWRRPASTTSASRTASPTTTW